MRVEMMFNDKEIVKNGYVKEKVYATIKKGFGQKNIPCCSDGEILAFRDCGKEDDYANIWLVLFTLLDADWFKKIITSCIFIDDIGRREDVLA